MSEPLPDIRSLLDKIVKLREGEVGKLIESRIREFERVPPENWFSELCFCILTANSSAKIGIKAQRVIGNGFLTMDKDRLANLLREIGHPYYEKRAEYIVGARKHSNIYEVISRFRDERQAREWLVENVKGIGYKEASHFLRNVGYKNVAIIDRHVLRVMSKHGLIKDVPKNLTRKKYLELERILEKVAKEAGLTLAELDLYLWYIETGEVLK